MQRFQEVSFQDLWIMFKNNRTLAVLIFVLSLGLTGVIYTSFNPYSGEKSILVKNNENDQFTSFLNKMSSETQLNQKTNSKDFKSAIQELDSIDFYNFLIFKILNLKDNEISMVSLVGLKNLKSDFLSLFNLQTLNNYNQFISSISPEQKEQLLKFYSFLDQRIKKSFVSDLQKIKIEFSSSSFEESNLMNEILAPFAQEYLSQNELLKIKNIKDFIEKEKVINQEKYQHAQNQMLDFYSKSENLVSLSSEGRIGEYLSELRIRKNELRLKIKENEKIIAALSQESVNIKGSQIYGSQGRMQSLKLSNQVLKDQLQSLDNSIIRVTQEIKSAPHVKTNLEFIKKNLDESYKKLSEFNQIESLMASLETAATNKYMVSTEFRYPLVDKKYSFVKLFSVFLFVGSILFFMILYLKLLWDHNEITSQNSREAVVISPEYSDPRFVLEKSKIKFRVDQTKTFTMESDIKDFKSLQFKFDEINSEKSSQDSNSDLS